MATAAQVSAKRANAKKSTGPRTPEGKAIVAQNAVQHRLLAQEVVIKGEDPERFALWREAMLADLAMVGEVESMLGQRIAGLGGRLRRVERLPGAGHTGRWPSWRNVSCCDRRPRRPGRRRTGRRVFVVCP